MSAIGTSNRAVSVRFRGRADMATVPLMSANDPERLLQLRRSTGIVCAMWRSRQIWVRHEAGQNQLAKPSSFANK
jgi:hypothetical protein